MMKYLSILFFAAICWVACENAGVTTAQNEGDTTQIESHDHDHDHGHDHDHDHADADMAAGDGKHFGEKISAEGAMAYNDLLLKMEGTDTLAAKVKGTVSKVCQVKGCWMTIQPDDPNKEAMMVQFKDYGFFMPKDIAGRAVVMDGYAYRAVTSVEDLKHYAEDEGLPQEEIDKITEPKEELKFLASGVVLLDGEAQQ